MLETQISKRMGKDTDILNPIQQLSWIVGILSRRRMTKVFIYHTNLTQIITRFWPELQETRNLPLDKFSFPKNEYR